MNKEDLALLNEEQRQAVMHEGSPLLILAGAGSGKTRVITTKIAYLISEKNVKPWKILAVTFTKKAANEMKERAIKLDERASATQIKTFHSFGAWFLRKNAGIAKIEPNFTVYDDDDMSTLIQKAMPKLTKSRANHFAHLISIAKDYCYQPDDVELDAIDDDPEFRIVYQNYQNRLRETGNVDFGDLIMLPYLILKNNEEIRHEIHKMFTVVMVDEYQDSNVAQFLLLRELCGVNENSGNYVCVVGDDDQSIYKFRGAEVENILNFEKEFPGTTVIRLEKNYRSTAEILQTADDVVSNNENRLGKKLVAERGNGNKPVIAFLKNQDEEAAECVNLIKKTISMGAKYSDWAILYRTNAQSLTFETYFMQNKIPYQVVGSLKFYEREEVKDLLAYISILANPRDEIAFRRIVNKPARGIGGTTQDKIIENARESIMFEAESESVSMAKNYVDSCRELSETFTKKAREGAQKFYGTMDELKAALESGATKSSDNLSSLIRDIIEKSGLKEYYESEDEISGTQKVANMNELMNSAIPFRCSNEGLLEFLDHIQLDNTDADDESGAESKKDKVTLITFHNTKGLEFKRVIMTGMEHGVFPKTDKAGEELEEERRLCYVGITRARNSLYMTSCASRRMYGRTEFMDMSPFLREIDPEHVKIICSKGQEQRKRQLMRNVHGKNGLSNPTFIGTDPIAREYHRGVQIYHDDYGYGEITNGRMTDEGEYKIDVRFQNGKTMSFLPKYSKHSLEIIGD
ncbi:MAG: UvrD-helicase domain-containing protein [Treponema sp.]|nr:UvrD-helicase domain-containing protein [Treponema sp.]